MQMELSAGKSIGDPTAKWLNGWIPFYRLAGNPKSGWMPITALLDVRTNYDYLGPGTFQSKHPYITEMGSMNPLDYWKSLHLDTDAYVTDTPNTFRGTSDHQAFDTTNGNLTNITQNLPSAPMGFPTYEMRASYRDQALRLWDAVRPHGLTASSPSDAEYWFQLDGDSTLDDASTLAVTAMAATRAAQSNIHLVCDAITTTTAFAEKYDSTQDVDIYGIPASRLIPFRVVDPSSMSPHGKARWQAAHGGISYPFTIFSAGREFPPHPAQVMALSYLAHAANMVAGLRPPFVSRFFANDQIQDSDASTWNSKVNSSVDDKVFSSDRSKDFRQESLTPYWLSYDTACQKDTKEVAFVDATNRRWLLLTNNTMVGASALTSLKTGMLDNMTNPDDAGDPGYLNPQVKTDPAARAAQSSIQS